MKDLQTSSDIYQQWHGHFGDTWATINLLLNMSVCRNEIIQLHHYREEQRVMQLEIIEALDSPGRIQQTTAPFTKPLDGFSVWCGSYFPTKRRWKPFEKHSKIAIQLDGISSADIKNPSPLETKMVIKTLEEFCPGFEVVPIGKQLGVAGSIEVIEQSLFFIGVNSGMSLIAYSAGIPAFILEYKLPVITTTCGKAHTVCKGAGEFKSRLKNWLKFLQDIGHPDCQGIAL